MESVFFLSPTTVFFPKVTFQARISWKLIRLAGKSRRSCLLLGALA